MSEGTRKFTVILEPDERVGYAVYCPAVKCSSQGHDRAEALEMIVECIQITLDEYENTRKSNPSLVALPLEETPELLSEEVRDILEVRFEYEMPITLEMVEVIVPVQVLV